MHHAENALFPLSERKVQYYLDRTLNPQSIASDDTGPRGIVGVIGNIGALQGAIMLVLGSPWYSDQITMDDCMSFVDPRYRKTNHSKALISYAKHMVDQIRESGHPDFKMVVGIVSTDRTAAKIRLYARQMEPVGAFFLYPAPAETRPLKNIHRN